MHPILESIRDRVPNAQICVVYADLGDTASVKGVVPKALEAFNSLLGDATIDIFVNCAGIQRRAPAEAFPEDDWDAVSVFSSLVSLCSRTRLVGSLYDINKTTSRGTAFALAILILYTYTQPVTSLCHVFSRFNLFIHLPKYHFSPMTLSRSFFSLSHSRPLFHAFLLYHRHFAFTFAWVWNLFSLHFTPHFCPCVIYAAILFRALTPLHHSIFPALWNYMFYIPFGYVAHLR